MISLQEEISDIFSVLHDGHIESSERNEDTLSFSVSIMYLTERIEGSNMIHVALFGYRNSEFIAWMKDGNSKTISDYSLTDLDILSGKVEEGRIRADFSNHSSDSEYCGGTLYFECDSYAIEAPEGKSITLHAIKEVAAKYWGDFGKK
ncbi:MAG: hypothetical protein AAGJ81_08185 [Verrucomicrobiota bacterium]